MSNRALFSSPTCGYSMKKISIWLKFKVRDVIKIRGLVVSILAPDVNDPRSIHLATMKNIFFFLFLLFLSLLTRLFESF